MAESASSAASGSLPDRSHIIAVAKFLLRFLTGPQVSKINQQFLSSWDRNQQVMWTGNILEVAKKWASQRGKRTLSMAMGPLMKRDDSPCFKAGNGKGSLTRYMRGASALFAWHITADDVVTILCPPPPDRLNPGGGTNMQLVELPILTGMIGGRSVTRIDLIHPEVKGAEDFRYQLWPVDEVHIWIQEFAKATIPRTMWLQRARTSQVRQIEEMLRSISSNPEENAIYNAILPKKASAVTETATMPPQSVEEQIITDAAHEQKDTAPGNSEASSREGCKVQGIDGGESSVHEPKISKKQKKKIKKDERKMRKKKQVAIGESALSSERGEADEESKIQQQTPGKNIEAKETSVSVQDTTTLATESLDKYEAMNDLRQSQLSTSMATETPELLDMGDPSTQGEGLSKLAKKKLKKELKRIAKDKRDAEAAANMAASTTTSGAGANKAAIRRNFRPAKIKNKRNQQLPQICQNYYASNICKAQMNEKATELVCWGSAANLRFA
ncbi:hypothetical protein FDECE_1220 [Fusarium decemcellulare]|nr:hypothetical protein FDECE_1220 [Fusarium decemcellulare]